MQGAEGHVPSAAAAALFLCWFKITMKLWKNFQCLQCRIITSKEITQSPNPFLLQKFFLSGVTDATVRVKLKGSDWKSFQAVCWSTSIHEMMLPKAHFYEQL